MNRHFVFYERETDLYCPLCGEPIYKNGIKIEDMHSIDDNIVEDISKQKTITVLCRNNNDHVYLYIRKA